MTQKTRQDWLRKMYQIRAFEEQAEQGIGLSEVIGSGPRGRVQEKDVARWQEDKVTLSRSRCMIGNLSIGCCSPIRIRFPHVFPGALGDECPSIFEGPTLIFASGNEPWSDLRA